ncbi:MAG: hypothetical protein EB059_01085 [Alphaproteobacteria bacterium]|nr:hypothetical protein [Alphaproteobacteria bacterium]
MLAAQLLLAHHYIIHFNEDTQNGIAQQHAQNSGAPSDDSNHEKSRHQNKCHICVFSKTLSQLLPFAAVMALVITLLRVHFTPAVEQRLRAYQPSVYSARGPPLFLS